MKEMRESFVPVGSTYPGSSYLEIANPDNAPVQLGDTNYLEQLNGDITNQAGKVVGYIDDNGGVHFTDSTAYADAVAQHNGITGIEQFSDGGIRVRFSNGDFDDFTAQQVANGDLSVASGPVGWVNDSLSYQGKQVGHYDSKGNVVVDVKGVGYKGVSSGGVVQVVPEAPEQATLLSTQTSAGGLIVKNPQTGRIDYRPADRPDIYTLDSSGAYFVDANGNPAIVSDPEAFTAFRETSYVDKIETQYGTYERTLDGAYVGPMWKDFPLEVTPFAGKVEIGGVFYTVGAPSTMPVKVMSIDGGTATVNFNGIDYKISADALGKAQVGQTAQLSAEQVGQLGRGFGVYADGLLSGLGDTFGNFFDAAIGTVTMPFKMVGKVWDFGKTWRTKGWDEATKGAGAFLDNMWKNVGQNWKSGFTSFGQAFNPKVTGDLAAFAKTGKLSDLGKDAFGNTPDSIKQFITEQQKEAAALAKGKTVAAKDALKGLPVAVSNVAQYPIMILQTHESGNQKDTTKSVKVKSENALEASQGSTTDSTVGTTLDGTNMASAAVAMATLLKNNPVDLNLLKESDLDLTKDKDQKTLRQRRDLLLQMYAVSAQVIAEGSMAISSDFYDRINALSETLTETTGSLGAASVLNDSERYPYFEMVRQTALSATQLGLKGAAILPNLQAMHSYHINNNK
jgi:hypothetical protein